MSVSKKTAGILATLLMTSATSPLRADTKSAIAIDPEHITGALNSSGLRVDRTQIEMLCSVTAAKTNPVLKVTNVESLDDGSAKARLQCERNDVCLPFYVVLHWKNDDEAKSAVTRWPGMRNARATRRTVKPEDILVRSGADATLIFESANIRMSVPVLCLQNGAKGQQIRVMSKDRKKVYLAKVLSAGVVASLMVN